MTALIEFKKISKHFGAVAANADISFTIQAGTIHGIIGENGAGKSTAMKILFGLYQPDHGEIFIRGKQVHFSSPTDAMENKIGMVHQHFMLAEPMSALDNIILHDKKSGFVLNRKKRLKELQELAAKYSFEMDLTKNIQDLPVGLQQRVEILKILSQESDVIILDEPTAVLTPQEVDSLFVNLEKLKAMGKTIIIITHKLKEVVRITDNVTVFRHGKVVAERSTQQTNCDELAELMVGHKIHPPAERKSSVDFSKKIIELKDVSSNTESSDTKHLNFSIHSKEIVGIAGVEGNGQNALIQLLIDPAHTDSLSGKILFNEVEINNLTSLEIRELGAGAFPEDRLKFGVVAQRPVFENFLLGLHRFKEYTRGPFINFKKLLSKVDQAIKDYDIRPKSNTHTLAKMSGGNQQKLVVARELSHKPSFILAAQPTRGVDIGAIEFIHEQLRISRDSGSGVLLISSELDELLTLSDRILVMYKGQIIAEYPRNQFDSFKIGAAMGGNPT